MVQKYTVINYYEISILFYFVSKTNIDINSRLFLFNKNSVVKYSIKIF